MPIPFGKTIYKLAKVFWYIFRPKSYGAKGALLYKNKILLVRQAYTPHLWSLPGGRIKKGETVDAGFRREVKEEVDIDVRNIEKIESRIFTHEYKKDHVTFFKALIDQDNFNIDNFEIIEAGWFPLSSLPENIGPITREAIEKVKEKPLDKLGTSS